MSSERSASIKRGSTKSGIKSPKSPRLKIDSSAITSESEPEDNSQISVKKDKNALRIGLEYKAGHEPSETFVQRLKDDFPQAKFEFNTIETEEKDVFEYTLNEKMVWSYKMLKEYPNYDELHEVTYWMEQGKSFMHMYLCSYMEGGEVRMVINDRRNTPFLKRAILACTIS